MALPASGPISVNQVAVEFGKPNYMSAFYGVTGGIPTSGPIALSQFYGKSNSSGKFWRMTVKAHSAGYALSLREAKFALSVGGANQPPIGVVASSEDPTSTAAKLIDGNEASTYYSDTSGLGVWVRFEFPSAIALAEIRLLHTAGYSSPNELLFESSNTSDFSSVSYSKIFSNLNNTWGPDATWNGSSYSGGTYKSFVL